MYGSTISILYLQNQSDEVTCPKSHTKSVAEPSIWIQIQNLSKTSV